MKKQKQYNR